MRACRRCCRGQSCGQEARASLGHVTAQLRGLSSLLCAVRDNIYLTEFWLAKVASANWGIPGRGDIQSPVASVLPSLCLATISAYARRISQAILSPPRGRGTPV